MGLFIPRPTKFFMICLLRKEVYYCVKYFFLFCECAKFISLILTSSIWLINLCSMPYRA